MSLRNWLRLFWSTLLVGGIASLIVGFGIQASDEELKVWDIYLIIWNFGAGLMYSVLSQMGFFAYLTINYIAQSAFRNRLTLWTALQWIIIIIVLVDLVMLRTVFLDTGKTWAEYSVLPIVMMVAAVLVALLKSKLTNFKAFTPTLFFVFVATILEAVPALREDNIFSIIAMIIPLFACNAWQLLVLHKLLKPKNNVAA